MIQNLIFDKRFRSIAFQIFLFLTVIFLFYWFAQNASNNISARGDRFGFDFLNNTSGFSILPTLGTWVFDYQVGKSTYLDVFFIGIVNTLVIAITGIIATTFLGFMIGIFRLSNNVVLKFFSSVYIEMFRNIPLLIHLFFWYFAVLRAVPGKREKN
jgi:general L-amino acid transport system permease protein